jgi:hypothetical protein
MACVLALGVAAPARAGNTWDGSAGDGKWSTATNWDDDVLPTGDPVFPASAPNKLVDLGATSRNAARFFLNGGYHLSNGRIGVQGGGDASEIRCTGDNRIDASYGTWGGGNAVKFVQAAGGTLTLNGISNGFIKDITFQGAGDFIVTSTVAPASGRAFGMNGTGTATFTSTSAITGASAGRFVTAGTLILDGSSDAAGTWTVTGGTLGGTGTLGSALAVGTSLGSVVAPGTPAVAGGVGTLRVNASVTFGDHGLLSVQVAGPGVSDLLDITGSLTLGRSSALRAVAVAGTTPAGTYTLVRYTGTLTGQFALIDGPPGARLDHSVPGQVRLVVDPLPLAESIAFPADADVLDVRAYGAVANDGLDDTAAIQAALNAFPNGNRIIYLPDGTWDVSDTLRWPAGTPGATDFKRTILQGQSRDGTLLRLRDGAPGFGDKALSKPVIYTGPAPAQRFRNAVRDLTVSVGRGNPGADGIQFNASNQGTVRRVRIRSEDGQGATGLNLAFTSEIGPLLVKDVHVIGFDHGVRTGDAINGIVVEGLTVEGQSVAGLRNGGQVFSLRGFKSINRVPAIINGTNPYGGVDTGGVLTLVDAYLIGTGEARNVSAITSAAFLFARNVISTGYRRVLEKPTINGTLVQAGASLAEYTSEAVEAEFPSAGRSLGLPVAETPDVPWDALADWVSPLAYGAVGNGTADDTAAIQAAIDSGKPTVYFPAGKTFRMTGDVFVRGGARRLIGTEGRFTGTGRFVVRDGTHPVVVIERMTAAPAVEHQGSRTLVLRHLLGAGVTGTGTGDLFIEDMVGGPVRLLNPAQRAWARQLNVELDGEVNVLNQGATLWVLGLKTERGNIKVDTQAGGATEVLGAHIYSTSQPKTAPIFRIHESRASFAGVAESNFDGNRYTDYVSETRGGVTSVLQAGETPPRTSANGNVIVLYSGFAP